MKCIWLAIPRTPTTAISTAALIYTVIVPIALIWCMEKEPYNLPLDTGNVTELVNFIVIFNSLQN